MTTDITELAQSLKNAASKALIEEGLTWFSEEQLSHEDGIAIHKADAEFIALANPANVLALVEALEKSQRANAAQDDHINQQQDRIDTLEKRNAELGREVIRLQSLKTVNAARQEAESEFHRGYSCGHKDASLESRTVTVKLPQAVSAGGQGYQEQVERILTASGIKVEDE